MQCWSHDIVTRKCQQTLPWKLFLYWSIVIWFVKSHVQHSGSSCSLSPRYTKTYFKFNKFSLTFLPLYFDNSNIESLKGQTLMTKSLLHKLKSLKKNIDIVNKQGRLISSKSSQICIGWLYNSWHNSLIECN